jgi:hypothetical protein
VRDRLAPGRRPIRPARTSASRTISSSSFITSSGIVAEKSSVCALRRRQRRAMRRTSGQKPMSIIRSASSSTNVSTREKSTALLRM